jgi:rhomboid protease GluP
MMQESGSAIQIRPNLKQIPVTTTLIAINVLISVLFFVAIFSLGMAEYANRYNSGRGLISEVIEHVVRLYNLGILYPDKVFEGQWWRLLSAAFLHAGWFHLLSNMLGLYVLGGIVEPLLGKVRYTIGYFATGIGSMAAVTVLSNLRLIDESAVVGASGAIMGLLGMMGAIFLVRWLRFKEAIAVQRLKMVGIISLFQVISDNIVPNVSKAGHMSGLTIGFFVGLFLVKTMVLKRR